MTPVRIRSFLKPKSRVRAAPFDNYEVRMAKTKLGSIKRFGARYGRTVKLKLAKIEKEQRKKHKCPYCSGLGVKRLAAGIWHCRKCDAKFTGRAYTISKDDKRVSADG